MKSRRLFWQKAILKKDTFILIEFVSKIGLEVFYNLFRAYSPYFIYCDLYMFYNYVFSKHLALASRPLTLLCLHLHKICNLGQNVSTRKCF